MYSYTYDKNGNILTISIDGTLKHSYVYDGLGQLKRENNVDSEETIVYTYDNGGNITSKTTGSTTVNYTYDSTWKDKLTAYNGQSITYDAIGNPLNYMGATIDLLQTVSKADNTADTVKSTKKGFQDTGLNMIDILKEISG